MAGPLFLAVANNTGTLEALPTLSAVTPQTGNNRVGILVASWEKGATSDFDVGSAAWGGTAFSKLGTIYSSANSAEARNALSFWYILETDFPASAGDITLTASGTTSANHIDVVFVQYEDAAQQAPDNLLSDIPAGASATVDFTTAVADCLLVEAATNGLDATWTLQSSQTSRFADAGGGATNVGTIVADKAAATATTYNETIDISSAQRFLMAVTALRPVAAVDSGAGSASGAATVTGIGASEARSVGSSNGVASVAGVGISDAEAVGSSSGVATVTGIGDSESGGGNGNGGNVIHDISPIRRPGRLIHRR